MRSVPQPFGPFEMYGLMKSLLSWMAHRWTNPPIRSQSNALDRRERIAQLASLANMRLLEESELISIVSKNSVDGVYIGWMLDSPELPVWLKAMQGETEIHDIKVVLMDDPAAIWNESKEAFFSIFPCLRGRSTKAAPAMSVWDRGKCNACSFADAARQAITKMRSTRGAPKT